MNLHTFYHRCRVEVLLSLNEAWNAFDSKHEKNFFEESLDFWSSALSATHGSIGGDMVTNKKYFGLSPKAAKTSVFSCKSNLDR